VPNRVRVRTYGAFGDQLRAWRGDRDVEEIARQVRQLGLKFDGATLRGWEYGWSGNPDLSRFLALSLVYGRTLHEALAALFADRPTAVDLIRQFGTAHSTAEGGTDAIPSTRIKELLGKLETLERRNKDLTERLDAAGDLAVRLVNLAVIGEQDRAATGPSAKSRKRGRTPRR